MDRIISLAWQGDHRAIQALRQTARFLGVGLAGIYLGIDPQKIIIGGKITQVWDLVIDEIINQVTSQSFFQPAPVRDLIVPASLLRSTFDGGRALILRELFGGRFPTDIREHDQETAATI